MTCIFRAGLLSVLLVAGAVLAAGAQPSPIPAPLPAPTLCPASHYECGPGVCCPKLGG